MEKVNLGTNADASIQKGGSEVNKFLLKGRYTAKCYDALGNLKWKDSIDNLVTDVGANQFLDSALGAGPVAGPYMGLISSVGYTGVPVVGDTMGAHGTWNEAGNGINYPNWSTPASNARVTVVFAAAAARSKALSAQASFLIATNGGTVKGCFMVFGTGAVATNNNTGGVLLSTGLFIAGDKILEIGDTLLVSYSITI